MQCKRPQRFSSAHAPTDVCPGASVSPAEGGAPAVGGFFFLLDAHDDAPVGTGGLLLPFSDMPPSAPSASSAEPLATLALGTASPAPAEEGGAGGCWIGSLSRAMELLGAASTAEEGGARKYYARARRGTAARRSARRSARAHLASPHWLPRFQGVLAVHCRRLGSRHCCLRLRRQRRRRRSQGGEQPRCLRRHLRAETQQDSASCFLTRAPMRLCGQAGCRCQLEQRRLLHPRHRLRSRWRPWRLGLRLQLRKKSQAAACLAP